MMVNFEVISNLNLHFLLRTRYHHGCEDPHAGESLTGKTVRRVIRVFDAVRKPIKYLIIISTFTFMTLVFNVFFLTFYLIALGISQLFKSHHRNVINQRNDPWAVPKIEFYESRLQRSKRNFISRMFHKSKYKQPTGKLIRHGGWAGNIPPAPGDTQATAAQPQTKKSFFGRLFSRKKTQQQNGMPAQTAPKPSKKSFFGKIRGFFSKKPAAGVPQPQQGYQQYPAQQYAPHTSHGPHRLTKPNPGTAQSKPSWRTRLFGHSRNSVPPQQQPPSNGMPYGNGYAHPSNGSHHSTQSQRPDSTYSQSGGSGYEPYNAYNDGTASTQGPPQQQAAKKQGGGFFSSLFGFKRQPKVSNARQNSYNYV